MKEKKSIRYHLISCIAIAVVLLVWHLCTVTYEILPSTMFPSPGQVVKSFFVKLSDTRPDGATLFQHLAESLKVALSGYFIGIAVGIPLGICMGWYRKADMFVRPLFDLVKPVPGIAFIPLVIIFFGIGLLSKAMIIFLGVFIASVVNSYAGIKQTKAVHLWVGQTFGASNLQLLFKIAIPSALPMILTGMRVALGSAWGALVAAEMVASNRGFGYMIQKSRMILRPDLILVGMISIGVVGAILTSILSFIEKKIFKGGKW